MTQTARQFMSRRSQATVLAVAFILSITAAASARSGKQEQFSTIHIKNFGQMDERFYRGAQPSETDIKDLAALGVKTVIDLRDDPTSYEKQAVEAAGMHYVNIPMSDTHYPKEEQVQQFLKLATDPATGAFYVHCAGGRHRTGVAGAVYRMTVYGWDYDRTYGEMKDYDFYTRWGHGPMKDYVQDYWKKVQVGQIQVLNK
ncbi:MAG TPA: tyrosine-protein phosphatase [Blastocatellia bacterium]|nr:tyrosine-protein phosphatase [Blastocatellia bacterium]